MISIYISKGHFVLLDDSEIWYYKIQTLEGVKVMCGIRYSFVFHLFLWQIFFQILLPNC